ncbi:unnamed protein product [Notodromas monacha]|uniref:Methionine--tRNA ligase, mitochondrial n=1 Tax=Notodromas monacha TaxID=399045 RepID=A0A7R9BW13_9CRUS|nr:unnamed protein product [Notodromas monacha]CAG0921830.1 unnamed protein product [Notodromas monacha]
MRRLLSKFFAQKPTRNLPKLVTTPIFYVNDVPHVGHLYTALLGDAWSRFQRLQGIDYHFTTGTDEHGLKVHQSALKHGEDPLAFCDKVSGRFRQLFAEFDIQHSDFIRTTEERHIEAVEFFWECMQLSRLVSKSTYEGWYDSLDEVFIPEVNTTRAGDQRLAVGSNHVLTWSSEENYVFDLPQLKDDLLTWVQGPNRIHPASFLPILEKLIEDEIHKVSISRPASRLSWGIPVPGDESQTIYVWLDALVNYLTVCGYPKLQFWPGTHIIGKDILKFHGVYWPAFLMAAGLMPPKQLVVHSHWLVDNVKMSKSIGNTVNPLALKDQFSVDGWRYFLLREGVLGHDGNFNAGKMAALLNAELADTLGNLVLRCASVKLNPEQVYPHGTRNDLFPASLVDQVSENFQNFYFYRGLEEIQGVLRKCNAFVQESEPWVLRKQGKEEKLREVLFIAMDICRRCSILLQPVVPNYAGSVLDALGVDSDSRTLEHARLCAGGWNLGTIRPKFNKIAL